MARFLEAPSLLPLCIHAGLGALFLVLACVLPPLHVAALVGGSATAVGLVLARLRRDMLEEGPVPDLEARR